MSMIPPLNFLASALHFSLETLCQLSCLNDFGGEMAAVVSEPWEFTCYLEVDYESEENASIVYAALAVDKELQPDKIKWQIIVSKGKLSVHFEAVEARFLRASYSSFVDILTLATKRLKNLEKEWNLDILMCIFNIRFLDFTPSLL